LRDNERKRLAFNSENKHVAFDTNYGNFSHYTRTEKSFAKEEFHRFQSAAANAEVRTQ